jgi:hypothetical protein
MIPAAINPPACNGENRHNWRSRSALPGMIDQKRSYEVDHNAQEKSQRYWKRGVWVIFGRFEPNVSTERFDLTFRTNLSHERFDLTFRTCGLAWDRSQK